MAVHCSECGVKLETVEEGREHKRVQHPIRIWIVMPEDVKYKVVTGPGREVVVRVMEDDIPVRIMRTA